jgi:hypothetical protein
MTNILNIIRYFIKFCQTYARLSDSIGQEEYGRQNVIDLITLKFDFSRIRKCRVQTSS